MFNFFKRNKKTVLISILLLLGLIIRVHYVDKFLVGDLFSYAEWGEKLVTLGAREHYTRKGWYYSSPNYPPFSQVVFAGAYYLYDHKHVVAQLHNLIKFPPAVFIEYFYKNGYYLLLKLPSILADLGLSLLIYGVILKLTGSFKKAIVGLSIFLFNPITIFLSGYWGQTDSLVALLGLGSFLLLDKNKVALSMPLLFLSVYFKPSWTIFGLLYIFLLYIKKPKVSSILIGMFISLILFLVITIPFSGNNVLGFMSKLYKDFIPLPLGTFGKASNSAFNLQTIFFKIDIDYNTTAKLWGITSGTLGRVLFLATNIVGFWILKKQKGNLLSIVSSVFVVGLGAFLFSSQMLERYFFPAFASMIILGFVKPKYFISMIILNVIFLANIIYSFYRRGSDEIARPFIDNNFRLIKTLSTVEVLTFCYMVYDIVKEKYQKA